ncbi:hypothetical protein [Amnibacterium kyonggiense]
MPTRPRCPVCGTPGPRRIVYGLVLAEVLDDPGVAIGGCVVASNAPRWRCRNSTCEHEYGRAGDR